MQAPGDKTITAPKPIGRPTRFTAKLSDEICDRIATGESLNTICQDLGIAYRAVLMWLRKYPEFMLKYMRARDEQADFYADELRDIAYNVPADKDAIEKAKLKSENLKWIASKLKPRKYGDKLDLTSDGEKLEQPIYGGLSVAPKQRTAVEGEVVKPKQIESETKPQLDKKRKR